MRVLILGGTMEASALAQALAGHPQIEAILSLAGRTAHPLPSPLPMRIGGFGGVDGLTGWLRAHATDAVIDATHPFSVQMSFHARAACAALGLPLLRIARPPWQPGPGDRWTMVDTMGAAVNALGRAPRIVFLTVGSLSLAAFQAAPWHRYVVRSIDPPPAITVLPDRKLLLARGPFDAACEERLMRDEGIEILVTKNSGGAATQGKVLAARALQLPVVMVARPAAAAGDEVHSTAQALAWLACHGASSARRGV